MRKAAYVRLTEEQRADLSRRLERVALTGRQRRRLQILVLADRGQTDDEIARATGAGSSTVERLRKRVANEGLEVALTEKPRSGAPAKLDGKQEAMIVALACSDAPEGCAQWSARLLANRAVEMEIVESISESTVRRLLKKCAQAMAKAVVVHPEGERRFRCPHGRRPGVVCAAAGRDAAGCLHG
jgi:transposase